LAARVQLLEFPELKSCPFVQGVNSRCRHIGLRQKDSRSKYGFGIAAAKEYNSGFGSYARTEVASYA
jgi:hypothetical protein